MGKWGDGRSDLAAEAIHLGRAMVELMPDEQQVRSLWDQAQIKEVRELLMQAIALGGKGPYLIQAAIADLHLEEAREAYGRALALTESEPERRFLEGRLLELHPRSDVEREAFWTSFRAVR